MVLEWLRCRDAKWNDELREYLFTDEPIAGHEEEKADKQAPAEGSLGIGSLREGGK
jgi:hypothetical protein